ncbi:MAG: 5'-nucleotidase C-terminal domain-containing protein, partial [Fimbriimonadales bacterium]
MRRTQLLLGWVGLALAIGWGQVGLSQGESLGGVGERANPAAQTIVEAMRSATGAELALLGAAFFNESASVPSTNFSADDLIKALAHPDDEVVVLRLRGEQILQALERALELYPQKNNAFLQLAGAEVRFDPKAES